MLVSFMGFNEKIATFETAAAITAGTPVKLAANGKIIACEAGDEFIGIAVSQRGDFAGVQLRGYREAAASGSLSLGWNELVADGSGGVKAAETAGEGIKLLVVTTGSGKAGIML